MVPRGCSDRWGRGVPSAAFRRPLTRESVTDSVVRGGIVFIRGLTALGAEWRSDAEHRGRAVVPSGRSSRARSVRPDARARGRAEIANADEVRGGPALYHNT